MIKIGLMLMKSFFLIDNKSVGGFFFLFFLLFLRGVGVILGVYGKWQPKVARESIKYQREEKRKK